MERLINRRQQGDLGEASAIECLTRQGAAVSVPVGHSPDYDLVADPSASEFEIDQREAILRLVYGEALLESDTQPGEYPSGQRGGAVNAMASPSQVRILPPPSQLRIAERGTAPHGQTRVSGMISLRCGKDAAFLRLTT